MKVDITRRGFVAGTGSAALLAGIATPGTAAAQTASDYANVRSKWRRYLTAQGTGYSPTAAPYSTYIAGLNAEVAGYIATLNFANPELFDDPAVTGINDYGRTTRVIMGRLRMMAIAYAMNGAAQYNNTTLRDNIIRALAFVSTNRFYSGQLFATTSSPEPNTTGPATFSGNQYMWQIGLPRPLLDTLILMEAAIKAKAAGQIPGTSVSGTQLIANLCAAILYHNSDVNRFSGFTAGGANLSWNGQIYFLTGMLTENATTAAQGRTAMINAYKDVTSKDGFYPDGSCIQHGVFAYTGGYGLALLEIASCAINTMNGTPWAFDATTVDKVSQWATRSFNPLVYRGGIVSMVKGRTMARSYDQEVASGIVAAASVIVLSEFVPAAATLRSLVKSWLQADTTNAFYQYAVGGAATLYSWYLRETIINAATAAPETTGFYQYPLMDRVIHRRSGFSLGVALMSTKIANYESIGAENLRGWYQGSGATYLYRGTASDLRDAYWPTVDPYRMPGTTVDNRPLAAAEAQETKGVSIAGSAGYDGSGVAGMIHGDYLDYSAPKVPIAGTEDLKVYKTYFMFGDYVLCAGTGISNTAANTVETIIENRNIGETGTNAVTVNGTVRLGTVGAVAQNATTSGDIVFNRTSNQIQELAPASPGSTTWVHIDGVGGYLIPNGNPILRGVKESRTGKWQNINNSSGNDPATYTRRYVTLWLDHGVSPQSNGRSTYSYILAPTSASAAATQALATAAALPIVLRANTTSVQYASAQFGTTFLAGAMFWTDATVSTTASNPYLVCNRRAAVFVREVPGRFEVAIADPTEASTVPIVVTVRGPSTGVISADPGITVVRNASNFTVTFDPSGTRGQSRVVILSR
jgi:hyaluronate lyase